MAKYRVTMNTVATISVDDEDTASDKAWRAAEDYAQTIWGDPGAGVSAHASFDGIGDDRTEKVGD